MTDSLDFHGTWRDDLLQQHRIKFLAAETHTEQREAVDFITQILDWKAREAA